MHCAGKLVEHADEASAGSVAGMFLKSQTGPVNRSNQSMMAARYSSRVIMHVVMICVDGNLGLDR